MSVLGALALVLLAVGALLTLVLGLRLHAFLALLLTSLVVAVVGGVPAAEVAGEIQRAMGGTLGYISIVIGIGAMFGEILHRSGGAGRIARTLLDRFGEDRAPTALGLTGILVAIPVFFDVAFILLVPLLRSLTRRTGRPILGFAIPLLAGLAVAHAFIPPTPGPVAVAGLLGADLGWVILFGLLSGVPALIVGGLLFGRWIAPRIDPDEVARRVDAEPEPVTVELPTFGLVLSLIGLPLILILVATVSRVTLAEDHPWLGPLQLVGHPFSALLATTLLAFYLLGIRRGWSRAELETLASRSLEPVGLILLLTGAGGVLGKVLLATGAGEVVATWLATSSLPLIALAFGLALTIRIAQGSATVSMVTAAGLIAPVVDAAPQAPPQLAALTVAIAAGATACSHVNDSGFWLVSRYLGLTEQQTLRSWTVMTVLVGSTGFLAAAMLSWWL
ncbi:MAG: gluconate:H+ symporter [Acidobacteriota bacterium]